MGVAWDSNPRQKASGSQPCFDLARRLRARVPRLRLGPSGASSQPKIEAPKWASKDSGIDRSTGPLDIDQSIHSGGLRCRMQGVDSIETTTMMSKPAVGLSLSARKKRSGFLLEAGCRKPVERGGKEEAGVIRFDRPINVRPRTTQFGWGRQTQEASTRPVAGLYWHGANQNRSRAGRGRPMSAWPMRHDGRLSFASPVVFAHAPPQADWYCRAASLERTFAIQSRVWTRPIDRSTPID